MALTSTQAPGYTTDSVRTPHSHSQKFPKYSWIYLLKILNLPPPLLLESCWLSFSFNYLSPGLLQINLHCSPWVQSHSPPVSHARCFQSYLWKIQCGHIILLPNLFKISHCLLPGPSVNWLLPSSPWCLLLLSCTSLSSQYQSSPWMFTPYHTSRTIALRNPFSSSDYGILYAMWELDLGLQGDQISHF